MGWFRRKNNSINVPYPPEVKEIFNAALEPQWRWIDCKNQSEALRVLDKVSKITSSYELRVTYQERIPERSYRDWEGDVTRTSPEIKAHLEWYVKVDQDALERHIKRDALDKYVEDLKA